MPQDDADAPLTPTPPHPPRARPRTAQGQESASQTATLEADESQQEPTFPLPDPAADAKRHAAEWAALVCATPDDDDAEAETPGDNGGTSIDASGARNPSPAPLAPDSADETAVSRYRPRWEEAFLAALAVAGNVSKAADAVGIDRTITYDHRGRSPRFKRLWDEALERSADLLREEAFTRAAIGWHEPVFFGGEVVGHVLKKSDRMLEIELKRRDPSYRDKSALELSGPNQSPIRTQTEIQAQLVPYEPAVALLVDSLLSLHQLAASAPAPAALSALAGPVAIDVAPEAAPPSLPPGAGRPCPRGDAPGTNPYCPVCHGAGRIA